MTMASPPTGAIADLSYRHYDGPLHTRAIRWWIVAVAGIRLAIKKKGFWLVALLALSPYVPVLVMLYFQSQSPGGMSGAFLNAPPGQKYAVRFYQALDNQVFWLFILSLMVGASSIAADNQANALLVYLSKPLTKGDYLLGKWMGVFLTLFIIAFAPALALFVYCLLSYAGEGFLRDEPLLFFRMALATAIPAAVHASLILGCSAWSRTPRMAGAAYAGVYFVSSFLAISFWGIRYHGDLALGNLERHLSVDGVIKGLAQNVYAVTLRMPVGRRYRGIEQLSLSPPSPGIMLAIAAGLIVLGLLAARSRVRAVEVVRG